MGGDRHPHCISSRIIFSILFTCFISISYPSNAKSTEYTPPDTFLLDCGSAKRTTLDDDRIFKSDAETVSMLSTNEDVEFSVDSISVDPGSNFPSAAIPLCKTARIFPEESVYSFFISQPGKHWIRLYFFPLPHPLYDLKNAEFSVLADETVLLRDFSMNNETSPIIFKEYLVNATGKLMLKFQPKEGSHAFINAIEVYSAPDNLIPDSAFSAINPVNIYNGLANIPLEFCYRLNVGGPEITPKHDTLSRTWIPDITYNAFPQGAQNVTAAGKIKYPDEAQGAANPLIAPKWVYQTAQQMQDSQTMDPNFNLTWKMDVDPSFDYMIRLHFCDIISMRANDLYFNVYVNTLTAINSLDLSSKGGLATAYYTDMVLNSSSITDGKITVQVGPVPNGDSGQVNAILNGLEIMKLSNLAKSLDGFITADGTDMSSTASGSTKMKAVAGIGLALAATAMLFLGVVVVKWKRRPADWQKRNSFSSWLLPINSSQTSFLSSKSSRSSRTRSTFSSKKSRSSSTFFSNRGLGKFFSLKELKIATQNFDEKRVIGVGGFGKVYFGALEDGDKVAIKRGNPSSEQGINEFQTEIQMLSRLRHRHLVSLIGFCDEESEMILVYEFMANGPFRDHLYGKSDKPPLPWIQRLEICIGSARGLHYLHTGAAQGIIHRDVKTTNILLDENFVAKVSDFGLSKDAAMDQGHVSTAVKGSFGYLDPEYFRRQQLTEKSDVYSFGVVLFEVLCARPVICPGLPREQVSLADWALQQHRKGQLENIIDPRIAPTICPEALKKFVEAAEKCLADYGVDRPGMGDVLWSLEYALQLQQTFSQLNNPEDKSVMNLIEFDQPATILESSKTDPPSTSDASSEIMDVSSNVFESMGPQTGR
ncbi:hypothetical protein ACFE04_024774 [Oxalis oulophora]